MRWNDLRLRVASVIVLAPLALACVWFGPPIWTLLVSLAAIGLCVEWSRLCGVPARSMASVAASACLAASALLTAQGYARAGLLVLLACGTALLFTRRPHLAWCLPYVGASAVALVWLRDDPSAGRANLLFLLGIVWSSDIGGYVIGRLVGGPRLAPSISPGKTWSGALGSLAAVLLIGAVAWWWAEGASLQRALAVAALLGLVVQSGDLLESLIKRSFGVKDSGSLIPGHGGLLDRLDGCLAAAPVAAALLASDAGRGAFLWQ